jgi:hypothetical protein
MLRLLCPRETEPQYASRWRLYELQSRDTALAESRIKEFGRVVKGWVQVAHCRAWNSVQTLKPAARLNNI